MTNTSQSIRNVKEVQGFLKSVPRGTMRTAIKAIAEYLLGDDAHGLKHYEPYKYVAREKAYGKAFFSESQRKYVMARIRSGEFTPGVSQRTGETSKAWTMNETNSGYGYTLKNPTAGAYFTRANNGQARQPAGVGWRKVSKVITDNMRGALRNAVSKINKWLKDNAKK